MIGVWQKLVDFKWQDTAPIDLLKITKLEGQPWIGLYHMMAKQVFRDRYHINSFRKGQVGAFSLCLFSPSSCNLFCQ